MPAKREAPISWRPPKALRARIEALATERGRPLSKVLEELCESGLYVAQGTSLAVKRVDEPVTPSKGVTRKKRTTHCEHRRSPDEYCARCDA